LQISNSAADIYANTVKTKPKLEYKFDAIEALAEWQNYGSGMRGIAVRLRAAIKHLPKVPAYQGDLFRAVGMDLSTAKSFIKTGKFKCRSLESWAKQERQVMEYLANNGTLVGGKGRGVVVVFKTKSNKENCVLDIEALWRDKSLVACVDQYEDAGFYFDEGIEFRGSQKEVVIAKDFLSLTDVYCVLVGGKKIYGSKALIALKFDSKELRYEHI
jgi:hypothetical protein